LGKKGFYEAKEHEKNYKKLILVEKCCRTVLYKKK
jgi:hypothetical protein